MNGFKIMAETYHKMGEVSAEKTARIYDFLATCDDEDFCTLFDSTAFNEIAKSYLRLAVQNLVKKEILDDEQGVAIRQELVALFSEKTAKEVCEANR